MAAVAAPIRASPERMPNPPTAPVVKRESPVSPPPPPGTSAASAIPVESPVAKATPPVPGPSRETSQRASSEMRASAAVVPASAPASASARSSVYPGGLPDSLKRFHTYLEKAGIDTLERLHDVLDPKLHAEEPDWLKEWMSFMQEEGCGLSNKSDECVALYKLRPVATDQPFRAGLCSERPLGDTLNRQYQCSPPASFSVTDWYA